MTTIQIYHSEKAWYVPRNIAGKHICEQYPSETKPQTGKYHVHWKPIKCNPIQNVQLIPSFQKNTGNVEWMVSIDRGIWHVLTGPDWNHNFETGLLTERDSQILYIAVVMTVEATTTPPQSSQV